MKKILGFVGIFGVLGLRNFIKKEIKSKLDVSADNEVALRWKKKI